MTNIWTFGLLFAWTGQFSFWFMLFWSFFPLALAAAELHQLNKRYA